MQDIIARALALRNNGSSSGASAELAQKVQKIEDEYVRATDEKDIEEISSSIEAIKQEIEDKGAEVKASLDLNSAIKAIRPLSEIANYGAEYTYEVDDVLGKQEIIKITSEVNANDFVFITKDDGFIMFQFWDKNGRQSGFGGGKAGRQLVVIKNNGTGVIVSYGTNGAKVFDYNSDGTFKGVRDLSYAYKADILGIRNTTEYTPTADYHPATKKYVDDAIPTSLKNPFSLTFTGAASAVYDGSQAVTVDLPSSGSDEWQQIYNKTLDEDVESVVVDLPNLTKLKILIYGHQVTSDGSETSTKQASIGVFLSLTEIKEFKTVYTLNSVSAYNRNVASLMDFELDKQRNTVVGLVRYQQEGGQNSGANHSLCQTFGNFPDSEKNFFTRIRIAAQWKFVSEVGNVGRFAAGTKIKIYGA